MASGSRMLMVDTAFGGGGAPTPSYGGLCFTAENPGVTVNIVKVGNVSNVPVLYLETSRDGVSWESFSVGGSGITLANAGDKVYFRATELGNQRTAASGRAYNKFTISNGNAASTGNFYSILTRDYENVVDLADCVGSFVYALGLLFSGCTGLTEAPSFPATKLISMCYINMFSGCTGLTKAPSLPATTLDSGCYNNMFLNCTGLTEAPSLPATRIPTSAYEGMFLGCTALRSIYTKQTSFNGCKNWLPDNPGAVFHHTSALTIPTDRSTSNVPASWTTVADYD